MSEVDSEVLLELSIGPASEAVLMINEEGIHYNGKLLTDDKKIVDGMWEMLTNARSQQEKALQFKNGELLSIKAELDVILSELKIHGSYQQRQERKAEAVARVEQLLNLTDLAIRHEEPHWESLIPNFLLWRSGVDEEELLSDFDLALGWFTGKGCSHDEALEASECIRDEHGGTP